jgi:hypothetical protein
VVVGDLPCLSGGGLCQALRVLALPRALRHDLGQSSLQICAGCGSVANSSSWRDLIGLEKVGAQGRSPVWRQKGARYRHDLSDSRIRALASSLPCRVWDRAAVSQVGNAATATALLSTRRVAVDLHGEVVLLRFNFWRSVEINDVACWLNHAC